MKPGHDPQTLEFYAREAPDYVASGEGGVSRSLHGFLDRLPEGARILELGCGGGRDSAAMIERGFDVDPTDGVPAMAARAAERLGRPVRQLRFEQLVADSEYDAVWANASLLHVPRSAIVETLARIHRALRPRGLHFASYKAGGGEARDRFGRYFNYPSAEKLRAWYETAGDWTAIEIEAGKGGGYDGVEGPWLSATLTR